jgi:hypothetical protein
MCMLAILHQETGVAYLRNSPLSPRGRPSASLLDRGFKRVGKGPNVVYKSIAVSLSSSTTFLCQLPALLAILGLASACICTIAALGHPGPNFPLAATEGFLCSAGLRIFAPIRSFNRGCHPFSSFGNLILAWADVSFQLVSPSPIRPLLDSRM